MKDRSFVVGMVLIVLFTIAGTTIPIFGVVHDISPTEMGLLIHTFIGQNIMEVQTWINTGDNLLTLLGTIGGLIISGGFWTWRKGIAFKKGFDTGFCKGKDCNLSFNAEDKDLLLKRAGDALEGLQGRYAKVTAELIELKEADEKRQYDFQVEKHALEAANKNQSETLVKWKEDLQKERDETAKRVNKLYDEKRELEVRLEKEYHIAVSSGERQVASRIISHLLTTGQLFYSLDSKTGMVSLQLMGNAKVREAIPESEIKWLIDLSGLRQPNQMLVGKVHHVSGQQTACFDRLIKDIQTDGPISYNQLREEWVGNVEAKVACDLVHMDKEVYEKATSKYPPCVWCSDGENERYGNNQEGKHWCKKCGPFMLLWSQLFDIIAVQPHEAKKIREALDMPVRFFIKKYPNVRPAGLPDSCWHINPDNKTTVREYIRTWGMFSTRRA